MTLYAPWRRPTWVLLDAVDRHFRSAPEHREHRAILEEIDRIITPFPGGDFAAVKPENAIELPAVKGYFACGSGRMLARPRATRLDRYRRTPYGASFCRLSFMIAPEWTVGNSLARRKLIFLNRMTFCPRGLQNRTGAIPVLAATHLPPGITAWLANHNTALIPTSTRRAGLRNQYLLPQGPVRTRSGFLSPPAPRGVDGSGQRQQSSLYGSFPNSLGRRVAGLFYAVDRRRPAIEKEALAPRFVCCQSLAVPTAAGV